MVMWTASAVPVAKISAVTPDQKPYPMAVVEANVSTAVGQEFSPQALTEDIERLYKTGYFKYVDTRVTDVVGGKNVVFIVEPLPRVRTISFEGNEAISTKKLLKTIDTKEGELMVAKTVSADTREILDLYRDRGYHRTLVELAESEVPGREEVDLTWKIAEEPRHKVRRVIIEGNSVYTDRQLRREMLTKHNIWSRLFRVGYYNERKFTVDQRTLRQMYGDKGYLDATFELSENVGEKGNWVDLTVKVQEGVPYIVSAVQYEGNRLFGEDELRDVTGLVSGEPYDFSQQRDDVKAIQDKYRPLGYLRMVCRTDLDRDPRAATVKVVYRISEGVASTIRNITIGGNQDTQDKVIRRELRIQPGDLADANKIEASQRILENLGYFEEVTITPMSVPGDETLTDLDIRVKEAPTGTFTFGGGFSDTDGFVVSGEVTKSNFDLRRFLSTWPPKAGGGGQRVRLVLQAGNERTDFLLSFVEPWFLDRRLRLETNAFLRTRDYSEYTQRNTGADVMFTQQVAKFWRQNVGLGIDNVEISDVEDLPPVFTGFGFPTYPNEELREEEGNYWSNSLIYGLRRDTRNAFFNPTKGSRLSLQGTLAPQALGSYSDIYHLDVTGTKYLPLSSTNTLRLHGQLGVVDAISGDDPAIFDRYFAGGANSIRGFEWREVSPVDANEDSLGGQSILVGSVEFIHQFRNLSENVRGSLFCDFGNVWPDAYEFDADLNATIGLGLEINLPMGQGRIPIRLDYGWPVQTQQEHLSDSGRFHFNFGYHY